MQLFSRDLIEKKNIVAIILMMVLLILPLGVDLYHLKLYYIIVVLIIIPLTLYRILKSNSLERRFYFKWAKKRRKGPLLNMLNQTMKSIFFIVIAVLGGQYIGNGRTPHYIYSQLSINNIILLVSILLIFGALGGVTAWYENEKRYRRIYLNSNDNQIIHQPPS